MFMIFMSLVLQLVIGNGKTQERALENRGTEVRTSDLSRTPQDIWSLIGFEPNGGGVIYG